MQSIEEKRISDDSQPPEPTIPVLVERIRVALAKLLRWVRPTEVDKIRETVDELAVAFGGLLETILRQAHVQSAESIAVVLDRLEQLEARIAALEAEHDRAVGD